jgi:type IX secretion system PorP/SprF family membrane protein
MQANWHIGLSVSQIFESKMKIGNIEEYRYSEDIRLKRHYYLLADYRFNMNRNSNWEIEPSAVLMANERLGFAADITIKAYYRRQYWFGASGRTTGELIVMGGVKFKNYYFGYSYDYGFNGISSYSLGSHEITISAKFGDTAG